MKRRTCELSLQQCYEALGLEKNADLEALKHAYRRRAFELHPDLHPGNPNAGRDFQIVNEAYVILAKILAPEQKQQAAKKKDAGDAADAGSKQQEQTQESSSDAQSASRESDHEHHEGTQGEDAAQRTRRTAQAAYSKEEDVLRDLLNDPFARRVFEDIYEQMRDTQAPPPPPPSPQQPDSIKKNTLQSNAESEWGREHLSLDLGHGIGSAVKSWMRKQIDDEQTFYLPPALLRPGARIRLQIRRGIGDEVSTVEIKLPKDYIVGKPVRLKGMGKRIGRWQGDLYLTLVAKQQSQ